jgi:hypothetical protein
MREFPKTYKPDTHIHNFICDLNFFKGYLNRFELFIKEENELYEKYLNNPESDDELGQKFNFQRNHSNDLLNEYPNTLRKSTFISLWSNFEKSLNDLCEVYEYHLSLKVNFTDMKGKGIERSKLYLTKIIHLNFPTSSNWDKIMKLKRIRDKIVHSYSEVNDEDSQLLSDIKSFKNLKLYSINKKSIIEIEKPFLDGVINVFNGFSKELLDSIEKRVEHAT